MNKISGKKLNTTITREANTHTKVKKSLKKTITRIVRHRLAQQLRTNKLGE